MLKKIFKKIYILLIILSLIFIIFLTIKSKNKPQSNTITDSGKTQDYSVSKNGWLSVNSTNLQNEKKQNIQLTGLSSHGIQLYSDIIKYNNLKQE